MSIELSQGALDRLRLLFDEDDHARAIEMLQDRCGDNLSIGWDATPESLERIRFATLKLSCGSLDKLEDAVQLACLDWRDLLVNAEFANDPGAHRGWWPSNPKGTKA